MKRMDEVKQLLQKIGEDKPEALNSFLQFNQIVEEGGVIDLKNKELILVALALSNQCEWCISAHIASAIKAGASKEEILDSCMLAVVMGGGPKLMFMNIVYEELNKYEK